MGIRTKTERAKLAARHDPYFERVRKGCYVGYRKQENGAGTWIGRWRDNTGQQHYKPLGYMESYDQALKLLNEWFDANDAGVSPKSVNVEQTCKQYLDYLRNRKGDAATKDPEGRFSRLVFGSAFGMIPLDKLKTTDVSQWLNNQISHIDEKDTESIRGAKNGANRNLNALKAALNHAYKSRLVPSDAGWKSVGRYPNVSKRREHHLSKLERIRLIAALDDDLREFTLALLFTAARPGELAKLQVKDFNSRQGTISLPSGKANFRVASLSSGASRLFERNTKNKSDESLIFCRSDGSQWIKDKWKKPYKKAANSVGLAPGVVLYSIRHTAISEMISGGMDAFTVARLAGTSTAMIDKHYGHLMHAKVRNKLDQVQMV